MRIRSVALSPRNVLLLALLALPGCATRGTLAELGHPEFASCEPEARTLTLAESEDRSAFHAYTKDTRNGDYRLETWLNIAPIRSGSHVYIWYGVAPGTKEGEKIEAVCVAAYAVDQHELGIFRRECRVPEGLAPIGHDRSGKPILGRGEFEGRSLYLLSIDAKLATTGAREELVLEGSKDREDIVLFTYVRFQDGSVTIVPFQLSVPPPPP